MLPFVQAVSTDVTHTCWESASDALNMVRRTSQIHDANQLQLLQRLDRRQLAGGRRRENTKKDPASQTHRKSALEAITNGYLHLSRISRTGDLAEAGAAEGGVRITEVDIVERVERLRAQVERRAFGRRQIA